MSPNARGAMCMIGAMTAFTVNDALMKSLAGSLPLAQAVFLRGLLTTGLMLALALALRQFTLRVPRRDRFLIACRTCAEVTTAFFFLTALYNMHIANVSAIMQSLPLTVSLAGVVFLGQTIGRRRLAAILAGFIGVLLIVRPGAEGFTIYSLYVLAAVACVTVRDILSRKISQDVPSLLIALNNAIWVTVAFGVTSIWSEWAPVDFVSGLTLVGASLTVIVAYFLAVVSMRVGDIAAIAPFRYTSLLVAIVLGVVLFDERPDFLTLLGASMVVGTGLFTLWRESRLAAAGTG
ncbi:MAG: DMT family transporter [Pseudomonadota bacterium]